MPQIKFPGVPPLLENLGANIPGIPALLERASDFLRGVDFLTKDLIPQTAANSSQQWGVYKDGKPALIFETFVSIDFRQGSSIADFPLEPNSFESYNKVALPFDARVKFASGGTEEHRRALLESARAATASMDLFTIVTPEAVYRNVNIQHQDYRRTSTNGVGVIQIEMWFLEIRQAERTGVVTGGAAPTNGTATTDAAAVPVAGGVQGLSYVRDPSGISSFNAGFVQSQAPTQQLLSATGSATFNDRFFFPTGGQ